MYHPYRLLETLFHCIITSRTLFTLILCVISVLIVPFFSVILLYESYSMNLHLFYVITYYLKIHKNPLLKGRDTDT